MKILLLLLGMVLPLAAADQSGSIEKIAASAAKDYIGKSVVVTGQVAEVHISEKLVRLNLDKPFPQQPFTAVIFSNRTNLFRDLPSLKNKQIEVKGTVADFQGHPEVIINRTNQLVVLPVEKK